MANTDNSTGVSSVKRKMVLVATLASLIFYSTLRSDQFTATFRDNAALSSQVNKHVNETKGKENEENVRNETQTIQNDQSIHTIVQKKDTDSNNTNNSGMNSTYNTSTSMNNSKNSSDSPLTNSQSNQDKVNSKEKNIHKEGGNKNKQQQQQHCWRHCPQRINKIYFHHGSRGLGDRHTAIHMLAQMAGYLCAELELPPPSASLNPSHNDDKLVSEKVQWQDFFNITFIQDKSPVVSLNPSFGVDFKYWDAMPVYDEDEYENWLHIIQNGTDFVSAYKMLQEFSWNQEPNAETGFIWEIHVSIYDSNLFDEWLLPDPSEDTMQKAPEYNSKMQAYLTTYQYFHPNQKIHGCTYTNDDQVDTEPTHMKLLRERIKRRVHKHSLANSLYGYLHIRRGDAIDDCDTSVEEIRSFLACSLNGTEATGKNVTFVLGSDERDTAYRESILRLGDDFVHVKILDGDKLTRRVCSEVVKNGLMMEEIVDNNFYIYELEKIFWKENNFTSMTLSRRRTGCPKCVPLLKYHASVWNS